MEYTHTRMANDEAQPQIAYLIINRPQALNALNFAVMQELRDLIAQLDPQQTRVLIIKGAKYDTADNTGKKPKPAAFVAGADIKDMPMMDTKQAKEFIELGHFVMSALEQLPIPVIAEVDGFALGGGLELAIACDFIYASDRSTFGQPEVGLGIIPGFGGTQRLARLINRNQAKELIYTGKHIDAKSALQLGLINSVVPAEELPQEVYKLATQLCKKAPLAIKHSKAAINQGMDRQLDKAHQIEINEFLEAFASKDRIEGTTAFIERREANFIGQ